MDGSELVRAMAQGAPAWCAPNTALDFLGIDCDAMDCRECRSLVSDELNDAADLLEGAEAAKAELDALRGRTMPAGLSWPRFEDGGLVTFGDVYVDIDGEGHEAASVSFSEGYQYVSDGRSQYWFDGDCRLKRPAPADTQERIDADAEIEYESYWGCSGGRCEECPAKVGGEKPKERYGVSWCGTARILDLLRRQRELDAKGAAE